MRIAGVSKKILAAVLIGIASFAAGAVFAEIMMTTIIKPWITFVAFEPPYLRVDNVSLTYNIIHNIYTDAKVGVQNYGNTSASGVIYVFLLDTANEIIASGNTTVTLAEGATAIVTVPLTWLPNKTVADVMSGRITIEQTT